MASWLGGVARPYTSDTLLARFVGLGGGWVEVLGLTPVIHYWPGCGSGWELGGGWVEVLCLTPVIHY